MSGEAPNRALLIYSGGMDSTTALYEFRDTIKQCLSFDYGAKHNKRELEFAKLNSEKLAIKHTIVPLPFIADYFQSDLLLNSANEIPKGHYQAESMRRTVVPFRNGIMLSIACGLAESLGLQRVIVANHFGDHAIYPDCRAAFIEPMGQAMNAGSDGKVQLFAPYTHLTKAEIALRGRNFDVDYALTWSCYLGGEIHCGECGTCVERKEALKGNDPTRYNN